MQFSVGINKWGAISTVMYCNLNTLVLRAKFLYNVPVQHLSWSGTLPPTTALVCLQHVSHIQYIAKILFPRVVIQNQAFQLFSQGVIIISVYDKIHCTLFRLKDFSSLPQGLDFVIFFQFQNFVALLALTYSPHTLQDSTSQDSTFEFWRAVFSKFSSQQASFLRA